MNRLYDLDELLIDQAQYIEELEPFADTASITAKEMYFQGKNENLVIALKNEVFNIIKNDKLTFSTNSMWELITYLYDKPLVESFKQASKKNHQHFIKRLQVLGNNYAQLTQNVPDDQLMIYDDFESGDFWSLLEVENEGLVLAFKYAFQNGCPDIINKSYFNIPTLEAFDKIILRDFAYNPSGNEHLLPEIITALEEMTEEEIQPFGPLVWAFAAIASTYLFNDNYKRIYSGYRSFDFYELTNFAEAIV